MSAVLQVPEGGRTVTDFTRRYDVMIDAPVDKVFEYCRDPHHLFEGWPALEVTGVVMEPEGVGTTAHIAGANGMQRRADAEELASCVQPRTLGARRLFVRIASHR